MRDTDFVARLHRNFALLGGQLKTRLSTQLKPNLRIMLYWAPRLLCLQRFCW